MKTAAALRVAAETAKIEAEGIQPGRALVELSVQQETLAGYESSLTALRRWLSTTGREPAGTTPETPTAVLVTEPVFELYLLSCVRCKEKIPVVLRTALRKQQEILHMEVWAESAHSKCVMKGALYQGGTTRKAPLRGTMTREMFLALVQYTRERRPHMLNGILVQVGAALRISQLVAIESGQVSPSEGVFLTEDKRENADNLDDPAIGPHWKRLWCCNTRDLLLHMQSITPAGHLLFPRSVWSMAQYNAHLKEAFAALHWSDLLKFDGSHILRHAGVGFAKELGVPDEDLKMSAAMITLYSRPLQDRLTLAAKRAKKELHVPPTKAGKK
jgi:hypothetical protein